MTTTILLVALAIFGLVFVYFFATDLIRNKEEWKDEQASLVGSGSAGLIANFFDTLGIGSFAPLTAMLRGFKQVDDRIIPGTLNVCCTIPVIYQAFLFISGVQVDPLTLVSMLAAATIGSYVGASKVSQLPTKKVQQVVAIALLVTAVIFLLQQFNLFPSGGEATGLTGFKLVFAVAVNFVLGALMTAGIGLYAPCMALVYLLGMSPLVAFPIMMGSCAFLMPVASVKFIKEGAYSRKASLWITIFGAIGVFVAYNFVTSLDLYLLKWLVIAVVIFTAVNLLRSAMRTETSAQKAAKGAKAVGANE